MKFSEQDVKSLNEQFKDSTPEEILEWTLDYLHPNVGLATSFQFQGMVLIDLLMKVDKNARIFTLDTGRLNKETYDVMEQVNNRYGAKVEIIFPDKVEVEEMVNQNGINLFYRGVDQRRLCCKIRKTNPLNKFLKTLDGWITSIRKDQTENRMDAKPFEIDYLHGKMLKINPILDWTSEQIWEYINENNVPYNKLHDIPSIGCAPCTRAVRPGEDERAGRWWWESDSDKECGIHYNYNS